MSGNIANGITGSSIVDNCALGNFVVTKDANNAWATGMPLSPPPVPIEKPWYDFSISEAENGFILYVRDKFGRQRSFIAETLNDAIDQVKAAFVADKLEK